MSSIKFLLPLLMVSGCVSFAYTRTTQNVAPDRGPNCQFDILTARPDRAFDELGVLENRGANTASVESFRDGIQSAVCAAGGDAVLAEVNGLGVYVRGTVIRYREAR